MIRVRQVKVPITDNNEQTIILKIATKLNVSIKKIKNYNITKKSIDARDKKNIFYVYEFDVLVENENNILRKNKSKDILKTPEESYKFLITGTLKMKHKPVIVGSGPAGLFCAYLLAENGYNPIIIERGEKIEDRVDTVEKFFKDNILNKNSNVQFGEGGAGTFSDGKLNTLTKDKYNRGKKVFEIFVENGAPKEILYENKPHIGTDLLRGVIINIRNKIIEMGGVFRYSTCLTNLIIKDSKITGIELNNKEILNCDSLVLAIGHSARDTFKMLLSNNVDITSKPFAVGIRIQHPQKLINEAQYGKNKNLPNASYKLVYNTKSKRGVYSFCMCPGGYVVNSSSDLGETVINGMSNYKRDSINANSAIVVTVSEKDYGTGPLDGIRFQEKLESLAYELGDGKIPTQLYIDYKNNRNTKQFGSVKPVFKGDYNFTNINDIFPNYINQALVEGIEYFSKKIKDFNLDDAIISAVESRTSSPVRINRNEEFMSNIYGIYHCGEGSGYSGGITTSAIDGVKVAEKIAQIYMN